MNQCSRIVRTGSGCKGHVIPHFTKSGTGQVPSGLSSSILKASSILHIDASFKNPKEMSEEQHRPLLAGENVQHIDMLCMSHSICYMLLVAYYILYHGVCQ